MYDAQRSVDCTISRCFDFIYYCTVYSTICKAVIPSTIPFRHPQRHLLSTMINTTVDSEMRANHSDMGHSMADDNEDQTTTTIITVIGATLACIGIVGNLLSVTVFIQRLRCYGGSANLYFTVVSFCDLVMSASPVILFHHGMEWINSALNKLAHCTTELFLFKLPGPLGSLIVVLITIDRFTAVNFPIFFKTRSGARAAFVRVLIVALFLIAINWPHLGFLKPTVGHNNNVICKSGQLMIDYYYMVIIPYLHATCYCIIPSIGISSLNISIVYTVQKILKTAKQKTKTSGENSKIALFQNSRRLTFFCLLVSTTFLCISIPSMVFHILLLSMNIQHSSSTSHVYARSLLFLSKVRHSINIIVYSLSGAIYRKDFANMITKICCRCRNREDEVRIFETDLKTISENITD